MRIELTLKQFWQLKETIFHYEKAINASPNIISIEIKGDGGSILSRFGDKVRFEVSD